MSRLYVVKKEEDIIYLGEDKGGFIIFFKRYAKILIPLLLLLLLLSLYFTISSFNKSDEYNLDTEGVNVIFPDDNSVVINGTEESELNNVYYEKLGIPDEAILFEKKIKLDNMEITYYSDKTAKIVYNNGSIYRILPVNNNYGVDEKGIVNKDSKKVKLTIKKTVKTNHGTQIIYSDGSSEIIDNDVNIWVGNSNNVKENYITDNKVTYIKETKKYSNFIVEKAYDGTIIITDNSEKYIVRNEKDVTITENGYNFNNDNIAKVIETKRLNNNVIVEYFSDGSAIINDKGGIIEVRKSNSIVIKNNEFIRIKSSNIIKKVSSKKVDNKEIDYYNNGIAVIKENGKIIGYVKENGDLEVKSNQIPNLDDILIPVSNVKKENGITTIVFDDEMAIIETPDVTYVSVGEKINIDDGLRVKFESEKVNPTSIIITNTTKNKIKYRVVLEKSENTTLQDKYLSEIKYIMNPSDTPKNINSNIWNERGHENEYILYEGIVDKESTEDLLVSVWIEYANLENDAMDKYFYGTLKVYSTTDLTDD